jgi:hypothetical protein
VLQPDSLRKLINFIALALISFAALTKAEAQIQRQAAFGGTGEDALFSAVGTSDGGLLLGGHSSSEVSGNKTSPSQGNRDYWLVRLDANWNPLWDKTFGGTSNDILSVVQPAADGGYLLAGYSNSGISGNKTNANFSSLNDCWLVKVDAGGNKLWERNYGGLSSDLLYTIVPSGDGGFLLGGLSLSGASGNKTSAAFGGGDYWLVKVDADGNKLWDRSYGGTGADTLLSIVPTGDGGFLLGGYSGSGISGNKTNANFGLDDFWVLRIDSAGNKLWEQEYGGSGYDILHAIVRTSDGFLLAGYSSSPPSGNKTSDNYGAADFWLVKIDPNGNMLWDKSYGGDGSDYLYTAVPASNGGFLLGGASAFHSSGNKASQAFGNFDYWLVRVDGAGNKLWDQTFGGTGNEYIYGLMTDTNGAYVLSGHSDSDVSGNKTTPVFGLPDFWLLSVPEPVPAFVPGSPHWSAGQFQFQTVGAPGQTNVLEVSTNLSTWVPWLTNVCSPSGIDQITDPRATDDARFYRVRTSLGVP